MQPISVLGMDNTFIHNTDSTYPEQPLELLLRGFTGIVHQHAQENNALRKRCAQYEEQMQALPADSNIIADGKQKEVIAIFNAIYEAGYIVGVSKKQFMQRMADICGCPGIANYSQALYGIKNTYKYDEIFKNLAEVAHDEILKND